MHKCAAQGKVKKLFWFWFSRLYAQFSNHHHMAWGQRRSQSRVAIKTFDKCLEVCPIARKERASFHWYKIRQSKYFRLEAKNRIIKFWRGTKHPIWSTFRTATVFIKLKWVYCKLIHKRLLLVAVFRKNLSTGGREQTATLFYSCPSNWSEALQPAVSTTLWSIINVVSSMLHALTFNAVNFDNIIWRDLSSIREQMHKKLT